MAEMVEEDNLRKQMSPPVQPDLEILHSWRDPNNTLYGIKTFHNSRFVDPNSSCKGLVTIHFEEIQQGTKRVPCRECHEEIVVNIPALVAAVKLLD